MPTKAEVIAKVHEAENETLESGALSEQVAAFIASEKQGHASEVQTLRDALASAIAGTLTEEEGTEAMTALDSIVSRNNTIQELLTAAITPATTPLPPVEEPPTGGDTVARGRKGR